MPVNVNVSRARKLLALVLFLLTGTSALAQTSPPSTYVPQLVTFNGVPFGPCDVYQVALNVSNGVFYTCAPLTRVWVLAASGLVSTTNNWTGLNSFSQPITSTVATGTAPFSIASTTVVPNLNAQLHNGLTAPASAIVGISDTQALTNKTIDCTANTLAKNPCVVYSTASSSTNASISPTTMASAGGSGNTYRVSWYFTNTVLGASCTGNSTVQFNLIWNDPSEGSAGTSSLQNAVAIGSGTANGVLGPIPTHANYLNFYNTLPFRAKANTAVQYSVTFVAGTGCSPAPSYQVYPVLEQIQ